MQALEYRKIETAKLKEDLKKLQKEFMDKKLMHKMGKEKDTSKLVKLKKDIARIKTVISEKEVLNER